MNSACKECMLNKHLNNYPEGAPEELVREYQETLVRITDQTGAVPTGPEVFYEVKALRKRLFGEGEMDYAQIKRHFNALMLEIEPVLEKRVEASADPLKSAVQYAMMGNFIDFAALDKVEESKLMELIDRAPDITVDEDTLEQLRDRAAKARTLALITDNCGEIVMDKILLRQILRMNPDLSITVIVRGGPVANDATLEDAEQVGLTKLGRCIGNGTATDGTVLRILSREARETIAHADVVIAKGQANYETLYGCGYNIFFIFMCKCMLFMDRFKVPQFTGILAYEDPEILFNVYADEALLKRYRFRQILPEEGAQWTESAFRLKRLSRWRSCADSLRRSRSSFSWRRTAGPGKSPGSCAGFPQMRRALRTNSLQICRSMIPRRRLCTFWDSIFCPSIEVRDLRGSL